MWIDGIPHDNFFELSFINGYDKRKKLIRYVEYIIIC